MLAKLPLVDRYIFKNAIRPYLIGMIIITIVMLSNFLYQVADMIIMEDVPWPIVIQLLFYRLPEIMVETFPMAVLFAIMSGIGRLNRNGEFTALRMGGFSIYRLVIPLIIFGLIISGMTYLFNENIVPWSNQQAREIMRGEDLQGVMGVRGDEIYFEGPEGRIFYIDDYDEESGIMEQVVILERQAGGGEVNPEIITAEHGEIRDDEWGLYNGYFHRQGQDGLIDTDSNFSEFDLDISGDIEHFMGEQRSPAEMSREELQQEIELLRQGGVDVTELLVEYHMRVSLPLTALVFVLIGTPLSLGSRDSRALALGLTVIIIFLYYVVVSFARAFGLNELISPVTAAWLPHGIFTTLGILLIIFREKWSLLLAGLMSRIML